MQQGSSFYRETPLLVDLREVVSTAHFRNAPADWLIALSDVRNSTGAIEAGRYKEVNAASAACITALLNCTSDHNLPFTFNGDGIVMLIPPELDEQARGTLAAVRQMSREAFGLDVRVGIVPVTEVLNAGYQVRVARLRISENYEQAVFVGGGVNYAEKLIKDPEQADKYLIPPEQTGTASYQGFECRWENIPSRFEETVSLIISAVPASVEAENLVYRQALATIDAIYGDRQRRFPLLVEKLRLTLRPKGVRADALITQGGAGIGQVGRLLGANLLAKLFMALNYKNWASYKQILVDATDSEKFDGTLRMTISGQVAQRELLTQYLESQRQQGRLFYGVHTSNATLITCIIYDYFGQQVHFVDGSSGGYTLAARQLKTQMAAAKPPTGTQRKLTVNLN